MAGIADNSAFSSAPLRNSHGSPFCRLPKRDGALSFSPWPLLVPSSFDAKVLPEKLRQRADESRYILSAVLWKAANRRTDDQGYARLKCDVLRRIVNHRWLKQTTRALEDAGLLERDHRYMPGVHSMGYRLGSAYLRDSPAWIEPTLPKLAQKLSSFAAEYSATQKARQKPIHERLHAIQCEHLTVVPSEAEAILEAMAQSRPRAVFGQRVIVENLVARRLANHVATTGRWFNGLTACCREIRPALRIAGERMGSVDLSCAQPALLALAIKNVASYKQDTPLYSKFHSLLVSLITLSDSLSSLQKFFALPSEEGVSEFMRLASSGLVYEALAAETGLTREGVKRRFLVDVLAPRRLYPSPVREAFQRMFPAVDACVRRVNAKDHGTLIRFLQRMESWLVLECVAPRLVETVPIVTLHDSIFSRASDCAVVESAFRQTFDELGFGMRVKVEYWG